MVVLLAGLARRAHRIHPGPPLAWFEPAETDMEWDLDEEPNGEQCSDGESDEGERGRMLRIDYGQRIGSSAFGRDWGDGVNGVPRWGSGWSPSFWVASFLPGGGFSLCFLFAVVSGVLVCLKASE